jgi:two-component system OmpR family response regulator
MLSFVVKGHTRKAGLTCRGSCTSDSGDTGLALAKSTPYDAAIVDVMLPGLDGLSLVRRLRADRAEIASALLSARAARSKIA